MPWKSSATLVCPTSRRCSYCTASGTPWAPAEADQLGGTVEVDETYVGGKPRKRAGSSKRGRGTSKQPVVALVERGGRDSDPHLGHFQSVCLCIGLPRRGSGRAATGHLQRRYLSQPAWARAARPPRTSWRFLLILNGLYHESILSSLSILT